MPVGVAVAVGVAVPAAVAVDVAVGVPVGDGVELGVVVGDHAGVGVPPDPRSTLPFVVDAGGKPSLNWNPGWVILFGSV